MSSVFLFLVNSVKAILKRVPFALSQNHGYDLQTRRILTRYLRPESNCVDVGCHKGEILALMLRHAPEGRHWGFEPVPGLCAGLERAYGQRENVRILPVALADRRGTTHFNHVITNPSYSGIERRSYDRPNERDERIEVAIDRLDDIIPPEVHIDLIKIDVEGGELGVLQGARHILARDQPLVIFEHGLGGSDHYGTTPAEGVRNLRAGGSDDLDDGGLAYGASGTQRRSLHRFIPGASRILLRSRSGVGTGGVGYA